MEFWLKQGGYKFRFPVNPSDFSVSVSQKNTEVSVISVGDVNLLGKTGLKEVSIASFFPARDYSFGHNDGRKEPSDYVKLIEAWRISGAPVRFLVTGVHLNMECTIESFSFGEQDSTGDIYFTLSLKEYRRIRAKSVGDGLAVGTSNRPIPPPSSGRTYTVKRGDCLWSIAKQFYGDGSKYPQIYSANQAAIDQRNQGTGLPQYTIYAGQVFKVP